MRLFDNFPLLFKYLNLIQKWKTAEALSITYITKSHILLQLRIMGHNCMLENSGLFDNYLNRLYLVDTIFRKMTTRIYYEEHLKERINETIYEYIKQGWENICNDSPHVSHYIYEYKSMYNNYIIIHDWLERAVIKDFASSCKYDSSFYTELLFRIESGPTKTSNYYHMLQLLFIKNFWKQSQILKINSIIVESTEIEPYFSDLYYMFRLSYFFNDTAQLSIRLFDSLNNHDFYQEYEMRGFIIYLEHITSNMTKYFLDKLEKASLWPTRQKSPPPYLGGNDY